MKTLKNVVDTSKTKHCKDLKKNRETLIRQQVPIATKPASDLYRQNYDYVFGKKKRKEKVIMLAKNQDGIWLDE